MTVCIKTLHDVSKTDFEKIEVNDFWNTGDEKELKIHRIHAYPAKFPAFITNKALEYAKMNHHEPKLIADIFCGCGTVAFESKRNNIDFWGCDINPVATMIANTKSENYNINKLTQYYVKILNAYSKTECRDFGYDKINERLRYWYSKKEYNNLARLKVAIEETVPNRSKYRLFFVCAFSNILKSTSRWLTKSIKPQVDPNKKPADVMSAFSEQFLYMTTAYNEIQISGNAKTVIKTGSFLNPAIKRPKVDMIITSPPYVTSYEYADLHQLSSLWLDYTEDYRTLREGSVGSLYHTYNFERELKRLNKTGSQIVFRLFEKDKSQARSVAKYFLDMQQTAKECGNMLNSNGLVVFVIGDTEYKNVRIENSRHISEALLEVGFEEVTITKRKISGKILTPYRDESGKFSNDSSKRKVYNEEFIIIGRK